MLVNLKSFSASTLIEVPWLGLASVAMLLTWTPVTENTYRYLDTFPLQIHESLSHINVVKFISNFVPPRLLRAVILMKIR